MSKIWKASAISVSAVTLIWASAMAKDRTARTTAQDVCGYVGCSGGATACADIDVTVVLEPPVVVAPTEITVPVHCFEMGGY